MLYYDIMSHDWYHQTLHASTTATLIDLENQEHVKTELFWWMAKNEIRSTHFYFVLKSIRSEMTAAISTFKDSHSKNAKLLDFDPIRQHEIVPRLCPRKSGTPQVIKPRKTR